MNEVGVMEFAFLSKLAELILGALFSKLVDDVATRPQVASFRKILQGDPQEKQALTRALKVAYDQFDREYHELTASLFDEPFLNQRVIVDELVKLLMPRHRPDLARMEQAWRAQFSVDIAISLQEPLAYFIDACEMAIAAQPDLLRFVDSRAFQEMQLSLHRIEQWGAEEVSTLGQLLEITRQIEQHVRPPEPADSLPPFMVEPLPADYVNRPREYEQLIDTLLRRGQTHAITVTLRGAGGFGKTTLAQALCYDPRIRKAYPDGILWVTLGDDAKNILPGLRKLYRGLTGKEAQFIDEHDGSLQLSNVLSDLRCLLVIDDVWNSAHLRPFLVGGDRCARLVTTRIEHVVPKEAVLVPIDAMKIGEAVRLLSSELSGDEAEPQLAGLARRLGEWPLLLRLVNRVLYSYVTLRGLALPSAIAEIQQELDEFGMTAFDATDPAERNQAVAASVGISLRQLQRDAHYGRVVVGDEVTRFEEFAVFPEGVKVPITVIAMLWAETGKLPLVATKKLCERLYDFALVLYYDRQQETVVLHDVMHHYLQSVAGADSLIAWHQALINGYEKQCRGAWATMVDDGYFYQQLLWHMSRAGQHEQLEQLLEDFSWLSAKLQATDIAQLIADYSLRRDNDPSTAMGLLQGALRLSAHTLVRDRDQLASQLIGRLMGSEDAEVKTVLQKAIVVQNSPWLRPLTPNLIPPAAPLMRTIEAGVGRIYCIAVSPDGATLLVGGEGNKDYGGFTLKLLDFESGSDRVRLIGHRGTVRSVVFTKDGRHALSAASDNTLKVWDLLNKGREIKTLMGHSGWVRAVTFSDTGERIVSASADGTLIVWDWKSFERIYTLPGHTGPIAAVKAIPGTNQVVSASEDRSLQIWDIDTGKWVGKLGEHLSGVNAVAITPDGLHAVSASHDTSLKVWDLTSGQEKHALVGHEGDVASVIVLPNSEEIVSGSWDMQIRVWRLETGLMGMAPIDSTHYRGVTALATLPKTQGFISASHDGTIKEWDLTRDLNQSPMRTGHSGAWVQAVAFTPDNSRAISASWDNSLVVWDLETRQELLSLVGHRKRVRSIRVSPNGKKVVSCSDDHTVRIWSLDEEKELYCINAHEQYANDVAIIPGLEACVSVSRDGWVKVWSLENGALITQFHAEEPLLTCQATQGGATIVVGAASGRLHFLRLEYSGLIV